MSYTEAKEATLEEILDAHNYLGFIEDAEMHQVGIEWERANPKTRGMCPVKKLR